MYIPTAEYTQRTSFGYLIFNIKIKAIDGGARARKGETMCGSCAAKEHVAFVLRQTISGEDL